MNYFEAPDFDGHEHVSFCCDEESGLKAIIAIHRSRRLNVAGGGIRFFPYNDSQSALTDVLRLSKGMTYKSALAGMPYGGAKAVIIGDPQKLKTSQLLMAFGRFVDRLGGRYVCAEDIGMTPADMTVIHGVTPYATGLPGKSGDTSPLTGLGVYHAIRASSDRFLGGQLKSVGILGFGNVGRHLAGHLKAQGVSLYVSDINNANLVTAVEQYGATVVPSGKFFSLDVDLIAPCSIGAVLNDSTIPDIKAKIICGGANNQLADVGRHGPMLEQRGVVFVPDYIANAGGAISGASERTGATLAETTQLVERIYDRCINVFNHSAENNLTPIAASEEIARQILDDERLAASQLDVATIG